MTDKFSSIDENWNIIRVRNERRMEGDKKNRRERERKKVWEGEKLRDRSEIVWKFSIPLISWVSVYILKPNCNLTLVPSQLQGTIQAAA